MAIDLQRAGSAGEQFLTRAETVPGSHAGSLQEF
jgi:hypothetical protein